MTTEDELRDLKARSEAARTFEEYVPLVADIPSLCASHLAANAEIELLRNALTDVLVYWTGPKKECPAWVRARQILTGGKEGGA